MMQQEKLIPAKNFFRGEHRVSFFDRIKTRVEVFFGSIALKWTAKRHFHEWRHHQIFQDAAYLLPEMQKEELLKRFGTTDVSLHYLRDKGDYREFLEYRYMGYIDHRDKIPTRQWFLYVVKYDTNKEKSYDKVELFNDFLQDIEYTRNNETPKRKVSA